MKRNEIWFSNTRDSLSREKSIDLEETLGLWRGLFAVDLIAFSDVPSRLVLHTVPLYDASFTHALSLVFLLPPHVTFLPSLLFRGLFLPVPPSSLSFHPGLLFRALLLSARSGHLGVHSACLAAPSLTDIKTHDLPRFS